LLLLKEKERAWAKLVGTATNLAFQLSGGMAGNLENVTLALGRSGVAVTFSEQAQDLLSASVHKRIDWLGEAFEVYTKISKD
jgi:hypothetical protein